MILGSTLLEDHSHTSSLKRATHSLIRSRFFTSHMRAQLSRMTGAAPELMALHRLSASSVSIRPVTVSPSIRLGRMERHRLHRRLSSSDTNSGRRAESGRLSICRISPSSVHGRTRVKHSRSGKHERMASLTWSRSGSLVGAMAFSRYWLAVMGTSLVSVRSRLKSLTTQVNRGIRASMESSALTCIC